MPFCASCGSQVEGGFCAKCGTKVGAAVPASGPEVQATSAMADNVASALCYVLGLVTGILFLVIPPYNRNPAIRFHAFQSIFLNLACIVASIVLNIVLGIVHPTPKSFTIDRNPYSRQIGIGVHDPPESSFTVDRNTHL